jgi:hypothetical protein
VFGQALRVNPLIVIFALLLGGEIAGFIGAFIALPIAAIIRESVVYLRRHLAFERWDLPGVPLRREGKHPPPADEVPPLLPADDAARCPECGAPREAGATTCPACGTELPEPEGEAAATSAAPR